MFRKVWTAGLIAAMAFAACSDKDPVSSVGGEGDAPPTDNDGNNNGIAPGEPHPDAPLTFEIWSVTDMAVDMNDDGTVDVDDFSIYIGKSSVDESAGGILSLLDQLRSAGFSVEITAEVADPLFSVNGQIIEVNGERVQVFEYDDPALAMSDSSRVSFDGSAVGDASINWIGIPNFFQAERVIVLLVSEDEKLIRSLAEALGVPFASGYRRDTDPDGGVVPDPVPDGTIPELELPALLVIDNLADAKQLLHWFPDADVEEMLSGVDFGTAWLVVASRGRMNTAGFDIEIEQVSTSADGVEIMVVLTDPDPDGETAQVITYPYDLTVVSVEDVPAESQILWVMRTSEGELLARTQFPVGGSTPGSEVDGTDPVEGRVTPTVEPGIVIDDVADISGDEDRVDDDGDQDVPVKIDIRGFVTALELIESDRDGTIGTVRIEGTLEQDTQVDQAVVTVTAETRILKADGAEIRTMRFGDLRTGQRVEALFTGPVMESYPVQAAAGTIVITR